MVFRYSGLERNFAQTKFHLMFQKLQQRFLVLSAAIFLLNSCEEKKDDPNPTPKGPIFSDTIATETSKGFTPIGILVSSAGVGSGIYNGSGDILSIVDMALLPDGKTLHVAISGSVAYQQGPNSSMDRLALDIETKTPLPGPSSNIGSVSTISYASSQSTFSNRYYGYQPGTNKFFSSKISVSNFGIVSASVSGDFTYGRSNTFASIPRITDLGEVVENVVTQTYARIDGNSGNQVFFNYQKANRGSMAFYWERVVKQDLIKSLAIVGGQVESTKINDDKVLVFCYSQKWLFVAEAHSTEPIGQLTFVDSLAFPAEWSGVGISTRRSEDGNGFGVVVGNSETDGSLTLLSAQYNIATKKLVKNITNLNIPKFNQGKINFDIDGQGNMYFDNWANNFQSDSTISIYKASGSAFSVVGQEDILKSGSIQNVRYLYGKVYAAVVYKYTISAGGITNTRHRIAILKQD